VSVGGSKTDATGVLKGLGEVGFGAERVDGGVEFAKLICRIGGSAQCQQRAPNRPVRRPLLVGGCKLAVLP